jgi:hypothetical protein
VRVPAKAWQIGAGMLLVVGLIVAAVLTSAPIRDATKPATPGSPSPLTPPHPSPSCAASQAEGNTATLQSFINAYNARDPSRLALVFKPQEIFDPAAFPYTNVVEQNPSTWATQGWGVGDDLALVSVCNYESGGAEVNIRRQNSILAAHGIPRLTVDYVASIDNGVITRLIGGIPTAPYADDDQARFEADFGAQLRADPAYQGQSPGPSP